MIDIKLDTEYYCNHCPEFEHDTHVERLYINNTVVQRIHIDCKHGVKCRGILKIFRENYREQYPSYYDRKSIKN